MVGSLFFYDDVVFFLILYFSFLDITLIWSKRNWLLAQLEFLKIWCLGGPVWKSSEFRTVSLELHALAKFEMNSIFLLTILTSNSLYIDRILKKDKNWYFVSLLKCNSLWFLPSHAILVWRSNESNLLILAQPNVPFRLPCC